jgi:hypothetical protein
MCLTDLKDSRKLRRMIAFANGSMAAGLLLRLFVHPIGSIPRDALDFAVGLLLGISITVNLHVLIVRKRNRENHA